MGELFTSEDVQNLFYNKFVIVFGDSIQRGVYRDLVYLLQRDKYMARADLKGKGEMSFMGDMLLEGGCLGERHNNKHYREIRQYQTDNYLVRYYYITGAHSEYLEECIDELADENQPKPDVIIMNSCIWDLTRNGNKGRRLYPDRLQITFHHLKSVLPESCLLLWLAALPLSDKVRGGVFLPGLDHCGHTIRYDVIEANYVAHLIANDMKVDLLDLHYNFVTQQGHREHDGIHWDAIAHRRMSNLILSHISEAWQIPLPRRWGDLPPNPNPPNNALAVYAPPPMYAPAQPPAPDVGGDDRRRGRHQRSSSCDARLLNQNHPHHGSSMPHLVPRHHHTPVVQNTNNHQFHDDFIPKGNDFIRVSNMMNGANAYNFQPYQNAPLQQNRRQFGHNHHGHGQWHVHHY